MAFDLFNSTGLIDTSTIDAPALQTVVGLVNDAYLLIGGIVGISIIFFILRFRETYKLRKRMEEIDEALILINEKLDAVLGIKVNIRKKKKAKKKKK